MRRIAVETHWYQVEGALRGVTAGTRTYDLHTTPNDVIAVKAVYHDGIPLMHVTERWLDLNRWDWRAEGNSTPLYYFLLGSTGISLHPIPATTDADALQVFYAAVPPSPTSASDTYSVPVALEDYIEMFCKLQASIKDATGEGRDRIGYFTRQVEMWEQRLAEYVRSMSQGELLIVGGDNEPGPDVYDMIRRKVITP